MTEYEDLIQRKLDLTQETFAVVREAQALDMPYRMLVSAERVAFWLNRDLNDEELAVMAKFGDVKARMGEVLLALDEMHSGTEGNA